MSERQAPPEGWFEFGELGGLGATPRMQFSVELDEDGDPLWERPANENEPPHPRIEVD